MGGNSKDNLLENSTFYNINSGTGHGCVYYLKRGYATVKNCSFKNITTEFGVLSIYDPAEDPTKNCTTAGMLVENCYFEDNYAHVEPGCINNCGQLIVKNSTFYKNRAFWWAGAIHTHGGANTTMWQVGTVEHYTPTVTYKFTTQHLQATIVQPTMVEEQLEHVIILQNIT